MADNISTKISKLINLGNENLAQKGIATTQTTMREVIDSIADIQIGISEEQLEQWAAVNTQLEEAVGVYNIVPTSARFFTFDGNACTGYVGDNSLPEIIIPRSYSTVSSIETVVGAKVLNKSEISYIIRDFVSATFSDGENNTHTYFSRPELKTLATDFPNDCYLVSMEVSDVFNFDFLNLAYDFQALQFPININGQNFADGMTAFDYIMEHDITNANFGGDVEVTKVVDGNDYQVTSVASVNDKSGFKNYQNRIILLSNLTSIGNFAFRDCFSLTSIEIPNSVTSIGVAVFYACSSLTSIEIPSGVTSIGDSVFFDCSSLTSITIPSGVTSIGGNAFRNCSGLTSISLPNGVTSIGESAFYGCTNIIKTEGELQYLKATVDGVLNEYFAVLDTTTTGITTANINANCKIIANSAFSYCRSLTSIEIPSGVTNIGGSVFWNCSSLTSIEIPSSVTSIGNYAFYGCRSLTTMTVLATTPPTLSNTNAISTATKKIYIPAGTLEAYQTATNWSNFASLFEELSQ